MSRRLTTLALLSFGGLATLSHAGCKPAPRPEGTTATASASVSATAVAAQTPGGLGTPFQCTPEGKVDTAIGAGNRAARQLLVVHGDTSPETYTLVTEGLCKRDPAFLACVAKQRESGPLPPRTTFSLVVNDHAITGVEGGGTPELRACLTTAWTGTPTAAATKLTFVYASPVAGLADVRARDLKAPEGVALEEVAEKLRGKNALLRACYEMALREQSTLAGNVSVEHDLDKAGISTKTRVKGDTLKHPSLESCLERRLSDLRFTAPKAGAAKLGYTLVFVAK